MINALKYLFLIPLFVFFVQIVGFSQQYNRITENSSLVVLKKRNPIFRKRMAIELIDKNENRILFYDDNLKKDSLQLRTIRKLYTSESIRLYPHKKFRYKKGLLFRMQTSFSENNNSIDFNFGKRFANRLEIGLGLGLHHNYYYGLQVPGSRINIDVFSIPTYATVQYIIRPARRSIVVRTSVGINNNNNGPFISELSNGLFARGSIGILFSSRNRMKSYLMLSQYTSKAKGTINTEINNQPATIGFDIWYNQFLFTYGIEIGR